MQAIITTVRVIFVSFAVTASIILLPAPGVIASSPPAAQKPRVVFRKAYIIDDRLSVLRREPRLKAELIQRMHLGRTVYVIGDRSLPGEPPFYRVAISRRTRGWVHQSAIAVAGRLGEDQRIWNLIQNDRDLDRITLCRLLVEQYPRSPLAPAALLLIGDEADRAARTLTRRAKRRLADLDDASSLRDYYLSDPALDRLNRVGVKFNFDASRGELVYDKQAYYQLIARFPRTKEAEQSQKRLEQAGLTPARVSR